MKVFNAAQLKEADLFTLLEQNLTSTQLLERAAMAIFECINETKVNCDSFVVFCGAGNNGGDGLALACLLAKANKNVLVVLLNEKPTHAFNAELLRLQSLNVPYITIKTQSQIDDLKIEESHCIVDALFGIGISRALQGLQAGLVLKINSWPNYKIAIDLPSGLSPDASFKSSPENTIIADETITIQCPKLSFFFPENKKFIGQLKSVDIGISQAFLGNTDACCYYTTNENITALIKPRSPIAHKSNFGHALIIAGSLGKIGASILSSEAALRSGCGLVTSAIPESAIGALLIVLPEAMTLVRDDSKAFVFDDINKFNAVGFGPGVGLTEQSSILLKYLLMHHGKIPLVIDADGLTLLSQNPSWYSDLNTHVMLTPHPGEFDRLTHIHNSGEERFKTQLEFSHKNNVYVLLKGSNTCITGPNGKAYFNSTGNQGMATAGSGDVLTGIITSLCAQKYEVLDALRIGAFLHGYAGDIAAKEVSQTSLIASDIIMHISDFFLAFEK